MQTPELEWLKAPTITIQFLWALPITSEEAAFVKENGIEELERRFDSGKLQYWGCPPGERCLIVSPRVDCRNIPIFAKYGY
jgi:hypothetical protein